MKRALSILSVSTCCISAAAQLSFQTNAPRGGDNVARKTISLTSPDQCSGFAVWDFGGKKIGTKKHVVRHVNQKVNGDSLWIYDAGTRYGLKLQEDGVSETSCENRNLSIKFDVPVKVLSFPMEYNDSIGGCFHGTGIYCDRRRMRSFGSWMLKADSKGSVIMPSGDTLRAMRVHLRKRISNIYYPLDSIRSTLAAFNADSIRHYQEADTAVIVSDEYRWYAGGYRYPVLEYRSAHMESKPGEKTHIAYICPPENLENLPLDDENTRIRDDNNKSGEGGRGEYADGNESGDNGFRYSFTQDSGSRRVRISYTAGRPVSAKAILASTMGIVYRTETSGKDTSGELTLDYGYLPTGQYIVYIKAGEKVFSEKFDNK